MKYGLYYSSSKDLLGVNTRPNLIQFSDEPNFFYVLTNDWIFLKEIEFNNNVEGRSSKVEEVIKNHLEDEDDFSNDSPSFVYN